MLDSGKVHTVVIICSENVFLASHYSGQSNGY